MNEIVGRMKKTGKDNSCLGNIHVHCANCSCVQKLNLLKSSGLKCGMEGGIWERTCLPVKSKRVLRNILRETFHCLLSGFVGSLLDVSTFRFLIIITLLLSKASKLV